MTEMHRAVRDEALAYYELKFRSQFLEARGMAFQDLFVSVMSRGHPEDFIACRPWGSAGDRKNDGYLKSSRTLFQVYAPNELRVRDTVQKIECDFAEASPFWQQHFGRWVFVHNATAGLPPDVIEALLELGRTHPHLEIVTWGLEELLLEVRNLSRESLESLWGRPPQASSPDTPTPARQRAKAATALAQDGKRSEAINAMLDALALARSQDLAEEEVEILAGLCLLSADRSNRKHRRGYLAEAAKKIDQVTRPVTRVIYLRAMATVLEEGGDAPGAETAYKAALAICEQTPDDEKHNLAIQLPIVQSSLVHTLCRQKRFEEAALILDRCERGASATPDAEDGELLHAALEAGIHYALDVGDEERVIDRVRQIERLATTPKRASRMGGDLINVANQASHRKAHRAALAAAQASIRLGRHCDHERFLTGALYTEAMVIMQAGDDDTALRKAEALLSICNSAEDLPIRQATHQLIAEVRRHSGDSEAAVQLARQAAASLSGDPTYVAFSKLALARALDDNGQTEEALMHAREAWTLLESDEDLPPSALIDVLSAVSDYASQLGLQEPTDQALAALDSLVDEHEDSVEEKGEGEGSRHCQPTTARTTH